MFCIFKCVKQAMKPESSTYLEMMNLGYCLDVERGSGIREKYKDLQEYLFPMCFSLNKMEDAWVDVSSYKPRIFYRNISLRKS